MILGEPNEKPTSTGIRGRATLDDLFLRALARRPDAIALIDPPNREDFTDRPPRTLTYAQADRLISAIAGRLHRIGLRSDAFVGLQLANSIEFVLTFLAVLRAGMIAMPLPLLWRRADMTAALSCAGASALIVNGRVGAHDQFDDALQAAAETFQIRFVCGFGPNLPDGVISLDELFDSEVAEPLPALEERPYPPGPAAHLAVVTWDTGADGPLPVARSHAELATGGLAVLLESRLKQEATILTTMTMSSFGGLSSALLPWLLVGGTLVLHHPFDPETFVRQLEATRPDAVILPGPMIGPLMEAAALKPGPHLGSVIAVWPAPDRLARVPAARALGSNVIDVQVFGEIGLIAGRRTANGEPAAAAFGPVAVPRGTKGGVIVGELRATANGTIAMRGPMVPRVAFPPGIEHTTLPQLKVGPGGFVDTRFAGRGEQRQSAMMVSAPPPGTISVGGYRFLMRDLQDVVAEVDAEATLAALPDLTMGNRLAGSSSDLAGIQRALAGRGVNPLLVNAFRELRPL